MHLETGQAELLVHGERDEVSTVRALMDTEQQIPGGGLLRYSDGGSLTKLRFCVNIPSGASPPP